MLVRIGWFLLLRCETTLKCHGSHKIFWFIGKQW